jgi:hypothetical protein
MTFQGILSDARSFRCGVEQKPSNGNWFGVSLYAPDWHFVLPSGAVITMSLQGPYTPYNAQYDALFHARAVKYIRVEYEWVKMWETWSGELPPYHIIDAIA